MSSRIKYFVVSSSTCLTVLLLVGGVLGKGATTNSDDTLKHIGVFTDVVAHIKTEYVEEPDMKSVTVGALNGLLEAIDPFASYLNADQYKDYLKNKDVKRADVGLILSKKFGWFGVVGTIPNSPAAKAGFTTGDMIESIKGIATRDMPLAYASLLLQGESNTTVDISVVRVRHAEPQTVKLTRANLIMPPVEVKMLPGEVAYINIDALYPGSVKEIASAVQKYQKEGARKLVLDVRNCATGTPEDGIALANLFLKQGRITYLKGQRVPQQNFDADPAKFVSDLPLAVLTNTGTADGTEIAASALSDNKRAQLVGQRTFGDAALRKPITMDDGGAIILSVAKYYAANGKAIQETGVTPGTVVAEPEPQIDYDENGEPIPSAQEAQPQQKKLEDDPVLKKALEILGVKA
ncbi:MAG TPA: S41 family peptidase, partial [Candidatus Sulfopaludibacter sp.]|nr:S41 family peptidase [Candidatus Sulfopaludibacter sp.]